jgi:hypothetical protein
MIVQLIHVNVNTFNKQERERDVLYNVRIYEYMQIFLPSADKALNLIYFYNKFF